MYRSLDRHTGAAFRNTQGRLVDDACAGSPRCDRLRLDEAARADVARIDWLEEATHAFCRSQERKSLRQARILKCFAWDAGSISDFADQGDVGAIAGSDVKHANFTVEADGAFRRDFAVARDRRPVHLHPVRMRLQPSGDAALVIVAAEDAIVMCIVGRLGRPDQCDLVTHLAQMSGGRRSDQAASHDREFDCFALHCDYLVALL